MLNNHIDHSFTIREQHGLVELRVTGELTGASATAFRSKIIQFLGHGKPNAYRVLTGLSQVNAEVTSSSELLVPTF